MAGDASDDWWPGGGSTLNICRLTGATGSSPRNVELEEEGVEGEV